MLKERQFYGAVKADVTPPALTMEQKIDRLVDLHRDAYQRLIKNREKGLATLQKKRANFSAASQEINQARLNLR